MPHGKHSPGYLQKYRDSHREQSRLYAKQYYQLHKKEKSEYWKKRWQTKEYKQVARKSRLKRLYGKDLIWYDEQLKLQNGCCAICGKPETKLDRYGNIKRLQVDHNHKTGKIRKLLCFSCNSLIGLCYESKEILQNAITYLG
jgi:hypothetical protein